MAASRATSNGPDWTDISLAMDSIGRFHKVELTLVMSPDGARDAGSLRLTMRATKPAGQAGDRHNSVSRSVWYPNWDSLTLEGAVFKLVYDLDRDCGSMWSQEVLPL